MRKLLLGATVALTLAAPAAAQTLTVMVAIEAAHLDPMRTSSPSFMAYLISDTLVSIKADTTAIAPAVVPQEGTPPAVTVGTEEPAAIGVGEEVAAGAGADQTVAAAPAGWYDDSERPGHKRWWDGTAWGKRDDEHPSTQEPPT